MRALEEGLNSAADLPEPVLFLGEPATGRSRAARRLHTLRTPKGPFMRLPAADLPPGGPEGRTLRLLEGGSLLITDLGSLGARAAESLAAVMDGFEGRDLRWLATGTTEKELAPPLATRFGGLVFRLPPLRERPEDLVPLFAALLRTAARREGRPEPLVERAVERELASRAWQGNLKEMQLCSEEALRLSEGGVLRRLPSAVPDSPPLQVAWPPAGELDEMLRAVGRNAAPALLARAMARHGGDLTEAAASLGLTVRVLASRLREHGISLEDRDP
jgi:DNA-binding NtrC family response regulator